ncbi:MAG: type II toxin-antitoxin system VapC family toxin [Candidatus Dormibacteraeota bacterium]|nr:type II toxin-antitoxin system VapC family toxin [Candidatus Dormibacteraeota bacterium]MBV9525498.1 type II toxin-antitoxin system VapC family toxin [Candidatus Dormibacteraeota bacterium]
MILVDSNVPMYLIGAAHPHKADALRRLERCIAERQRLVTDAEVFQEILHRYTAIARRDAIQRAFDVLREVVDDVLAIEETNVMRAKDILGTHQRLGPRHALHAAVMQAHGITRILSFDQAFDHVAGIERLA